MAAVAGFVAFVVVGGPLGTAALVAGVLIEVGELYFWHRFLRRYRVRTGSEGLVGERGEALVDLDPEGTARVHGEIWRVVVADGAGPVRAGAEVVVREVEGLRLAVEPTGAQLR